MVNKVIDYINKSQDPWGLLKIGSDKNREQIIKRNINKTGLILDLGCGFGIYSTLLKKLGNKVISMDISERMIRDGKKINQNLNFCINDSYNIPAKDNTFDAVLCMGTIIYVRDKTKFLKEVNRVAKPNRILCIIDRNKFSPFNYLLGKFKAAEKPVDSVNNFLTINKIKNNLKEANFLIENVEGDCLEIPFLSNFKPIKKILFFFGRFLPSLSYFIVIRSMAKKDR